MDREALGSIEARTADRAHVSVPVPDLDQATAAPSGRLVMSQQAKVLGFLRLHHVSPLIVTPSGSRLVVVIG